MIIKIIINFKLELKSGFSYEHTWLICASHRLQTAALRSYNRYLASEIMKQKQKALCCFWFLLIYEETLTSTATTGCSFAPFASFLAGSSTSCCSSSISASFRFFLAPSFPSSSPISSSLSSSGAAVAAGAGATTASPFSSLFSSSSSSSSPSSSSSAERKRVIR